MTLPNGNRTCQKCRERKPLAQFGTRCGRVDWLCSACRAATRPDFPDPNPSGLCQCGCGQQTSIVTKSQRDVGRIAGHHNRFIPGHQAIKSHVEWIEVDRGYKTPCWEWQRGRSGEDGYGVARIDGRNVPAHIVVYERLRGPFPAGLEPDHLCRNKPCVNPDHIEPVTHAENIRRAIAKLTPDDVRSIRATAGRETRRTLAERFSISIWTVDQIVHGETWRDVA